MQGNNNQIHNVNQTGPALAKSTTHSTGIYNSRAFLNANVP